MRARTSPYLAALWFAAPVLAADPPKEQVVVDSRKVVELRGGGTITIGSAGHT